MTRPPSESESPGTARLAWTAAFVFTACLGGAALASTRIAARWGLIPAAATAAAAALLLLVTLIRLAGRQRALLAAATRRAGDTHQLTDEIKQYRSELSRRAAEQQQLQVQIQRYASEREQLEDQRRADHSARAAALEKAFDQLLRVQLPLAFSGSAVPPPVAEDTVSGDGELAALCGQVLAAVSSGAAQLHEQLDEQRETARLAVVALARRVQASAHRIQEEATRMAQRHPADPDVLESSMRVDHAAAQQARHAQSMAVLSGEWPGQQWTEPLALVDVARAAAGRIVAYQRAAVSGDPDVAAAPRIAEPLIHVVAELLANATQSSPPASQVLVTVRTVQRGAVIEIDDGGVGMDEHRLEHAREIASGHRPAGLTSLGEIPQTGLAVVGQYARRHGLGVDLVPSPYGGIRAVTLVPSELVQILEPAGSSRPARPPAAFAAPAGTVLAADTPAADVPEAGAGDAGEPAAGTAAAQASTAGVPAAAAAGTPAAAAAGDPLRPGAQAPAPEIPGAGAPAAAAAALAAPGAQEHLAAGDTPTRHGEPAPAPAGDQPAPGRPAPAGPAAAEAVPVAPRRAAGPGVPGDPPTLPARRPRRPDSGPAVTAAGLPQRRSRRGQADLASARSLTAPVPAAPSASPPPAASPAEAGAWMGAFLGSGRGAGGRQTGRGERDGRSGNRPAE